MKKVFILPFLALAVLVSQAWSETCPGPSGANACEVGGGCFALSTEYSDTDDCAAGTCTCAQLVEMCNNYGAWYSGVTGLGSAPYGVGWKCSEHGGTMVGAGNETCGYYCKWATGCKEIKTDVNGANGPVLATCNDAIAACDRDASRYSNSSCTGTPVGGSDGGDLGYCDWGPCVFNPTDDYSCLEGGCFLIANETQLADCQSVLTSKSQCPASSLPKADGGGGTPILKFTPASQALIVAPFGRSLHISSARDATVSLYDMSGAKVYSGKVRAGNSVFSLERVSSGSYYAVVQSGSDAKKVPVVLK